ncbi:MAG: hypothetical protein LCH46_12055 [Proteobacteria bacterium]|nr:hypothetical protein [Pseudomonadota bacterium]
MSLALLWPTTPALPAAPSTTPNDEATLSTSPASNYELGVEAVPAGEETASFAARLTETSTRIARNVTWQVFDAEGAMLLDATSSAASLPLSPGSYEVRLELGAVNFQEAFAVPPGGAVTMSFVLNAGVLRVLPRLGQNPAAEIASESRIYALNGIAAGQLMSKSTQPGEMLVLPAGTYRVENQLGLGNAVAVSDVVVKAGVVSAMEFDHNAGLIRLAYEGQDASATAWEVRQGETVMIGNLTGPKADVVLRPGLYTAVMRAGSRLLQRDFTVTAGETGIVLIGQ